MSQRNLSTIIFDLKSQYKKTFGDKYINNPQLELIVNSAAYEIKFGRYCKWVENDKGFRFIKFY